MDHTPPSRLHDLADALGEIRAEIRTLKAREAALRDALIAARINGPVTGQRYEVTLRPSRRRVFDRTRLPAEILDDSRYWKTSLSQTLVARPIADPVCQPGPSGGAAAGPPGREAAANTSREAAPVARREAAPGSGRPAARNPWPHPEPAPRLALGAGGACSSRRGGGDDDDDPVLFEDF